MPERIIAYVDGTNFCAEIAKGSPARIRGRRSGNFHRGYFALAQEVIDTYISRNGKPRLIRRCWFSSYVGNEEVEESLRSGLREYRFSPTLFKRQAKNPEKGVDVALATSMLSDAYRRNIEIALLIAGDGDYIPLVEEVKRCGVVVAVAFLDGSCSPGLKHASDAFIGFCAPLGAGRGVTPTEQFFADQENAVEA